MGNEAAWALTVNGRRHTVVADPGTPLLYVLRNDLGLVGPRFGCGLGLCGAGNVLLDGRPVRSCDTPLWSVGAREITTVEALGPPHRPGPLQQSILDHRAAQCGFCISGILMTATALLAEDPKPDEPAIRAALDRNLCRCGSHNRIVRAIASTVEHSEPSLGAGEISTGPTTAAVANAIAALVGVRVRHLPITAEAIAAAITES